nr:MAG: capsid protein [Cressdnaviricota sp.]
MKYVRRRILTRRTRRTTRTVRRIRTTRSSRRGLSRSRKGSSYRRSRRRSYSSRSRRGAPSASFKARVIDAVSNVNTYITDAQTTAFPAANNCSWTFTNPLPHLTDLQTISNNILSSGSYASATLRWLLTECSVQHCVTNFSTFPVYVRHYICHSRRDVPTASGAPNLAAILLQGFVDSGAPSATNKTSATAYMSPTFASAYRISHVKTHTIQGGASFRATGHQHFRRLINKEHVAPGNTWGAWITIRGARVDLFQMWGSPAIDAGSLGTGLVITGSSKIGVVSQYRYKYKWSNDNANNVYFAENLIASGSLQNSVNRYTGAVVSDTNA